MKDQRRWKVVLRLRTENEQHVYSDERLSAARAVYSLGVLRGAQEFAVKDLKGSTELRKNVFFLKRVEDSI